MSVLKVLFNRNKKKEKKSVDYSEPIISAKMLYSSMKFKVILFTFSDHYAINVADFLMGCNKSLLSFVSATTTVEHIPNKEDIIKSDEFVINPEKISARVNYIIVSGDSLDFVDIYSDINYLQNPFMRVLEPLIYEYFSMDLFSVHVDNGVLSMSEFNKNLVFDKDITFDGGRITSIMDYDKVFPNVPSIFNNVKDAASIIHCVLDGAIVVDFNTAFNDYLYCDKDNAIDEAYTDTFMAIYGTSDYNDIYMISHSPRYALDDSDEEDNYKLASVGTSYNTDSIFEDKPEPFSGVADDTITYNDIDEVIDDSENMQ